MEILDNVYVEEATDLINDLEEALLLLERNKEDKSAVERIFRVMHTLKGSSNMFGFDHIGKLTHDLENIYDEVRNNRLQLSDEIYNITLESLDHIRNLLADQKLENKETRILQEELLEKINLVLENKSASGVTELQESKDSRKNGEKTWYIYFKPGSDILKKGNNPLYILEEIGTLGETKVIIHKENIPEIKQLQTDTCYVWWEIFLVTAKTESDMRDCFMFVEDESEIKISEVSDTAVFNLKAFTSYVEETASASKIIDVEELKARITAGNSLKSNGNSTAGNNGWTSKDKNISSIRVASDKLDELMNLVSELVTSQARLNLIAENSTAPELVMLAEEMDKVSRQLRDNAFSICLIPIQSIYMRFQRLVRDLSSDLSKQVDFITEGGDTELDKNIIEKIVDPIMHLLRNSLDHGIESPEIRKEKGKEEIGRLILKTFYSGSNVNIMISDDGAGLDLDKIREKAIHRGLIKADDHLTEQEIVNLIFHPGLTTAKNVTNVSGRGVGMDAVRQRIEEIRGEIEVSTEKDNGTTVIIKLPLTLSILDGILLKIGNNEYVIPLENVKKIYAINHSQLLNRFQQTIILDDEQYPFLHLRTEFGLTEDIPENEQIVLINYENKIVGLVVDKVEGEYQAVLKPIGKLYRKQEYILGATILGDGSVALVLDPFKIVKQFGN